MKKFQNIVNKFKSLTFVIILLIAWQIFSSMEMLPKFMLPSPTDIVMAFYNDRVLIFKNSIITLMEAFMGLSIGIFLGFLFAILMDNSKFLYKSLNPLILFTQTVPTVAIAPLLVLWMGYGMAPKITLVVIVTFFPITISLLEGFEQCDKNQINLLKSMGANKVQIYKYVKLPYSSSNFFSALKVSASYSIVGAVISEWLGGLGGLGVYMTKVRKAFAYDKMFAVIFFISALSFILTILIKIIQKKLTPWEDA